MNSEYIKTIFNDVAARYELVNSVLSFGLDSYWRKKLVNIANIQDKQSILDICCGTGNVAVALVSKNPNISITAIDFSEEMIEIAKQKHGIKYPQIKWLKLDITDFDLPENSFDLITCAFGIRNIDNLQKALDNIYRLSNTKGKVVFLEFSLPKRRLLRAVYTLYLNFILPVIGGIISRHFRHYKYLSSSIKYWTENIDFVGELYKAGFSSVQQCCLNGGIVKIFTAYKGK